MYYKNEHIRNLKVKFVKIFIKNKMDNFSRTFSEKDLTNTLYLRKIDREELLNVLFNQADNKYTFKPDVEKYLKDVFKYYEENKLKYNKQKGTFINEYEKYICEVERVGYNESKFQDFWSKINSFIPAIHWGSLPIYKEEYVSKRGLNNLDKNPFEYYNDYYTLSDLYKWVKVEDKWEPSLLGDCNLDIEMEFPVYTRRWGHEDYYRISRTTTGWYINFLSINGDSEKDGTGKIFANLKHDGVFFPEEDIKNAFSILWDDADRREMPISELKRKLQDIASWISNVEKAVKEHKPEWI
ncbi:MAG: hypothetical protein U0I99_00440 [Dialister sp.]|nr:hypothetical protein [Dialister sp.]